MQCSIYGAVIVVQHSTAQYSTAQHSIVLYSSMYSAVTVQYCVLCTVYCVHSTVPCVLCTVYCVLCTVYCVLWTVYCVPSHIYIYMLTYTHQRPGMRSAIGTQPSCNCQFREKSTFQSETGFAPLLLLPGYSRSRNRILTTFFQTRLCGELISLKL